MGTSVPPFYLDSYPPIQRLLDRMGQNERRDLRRMKREIKRRGNRDRRRALKRSLADNPDEAQFDDYEFKPRNSSKAWNGMFRDPGRQRASDEEE